MTDSDAEALWADRLNEGRFRLADGLGADRLARRYDVETSEAIAELTNRATLELLNSEYRTLSLEEFDAAAKRMDVEIQEVATDGGVDRTAASNVSIESDHGELKRRLAELIGTDPDRYNDRIGTERHGGLLLEEIDAVCDALGLSFLESEASKQEKRDAVMIKLGRDHRTGAQTWDASDLVAVITAVERSP